MLAKVYPQARFVLSDINARAVELARHNLRENGLSNAEAVCGDGFAAVEGKFDWILTNPPIRAGKQVIYALFAQAKDFLAPGGTLALVIRTQQGAKSAARSQCAVRQRRLASVSRAKEAAVPTSSSGNDCPVRAEKPLSTRSGAGRQVYCMAPVSSHARSRRRIISPAAGREITRIISPSAGIVP